MPVLCSTYANVPLKSWDESWGGTPALPASQADLPVVGLEHKVESATLQFIAITKSFPNRQAIELQEWMMRQSLLAHSRNAHSTFVVNDC
jgi:hypothetical protein